MSESVCSCGECVALGATHLDRAFRQVLEDRHLDETEHVLPLYQDVLFEGFQSGSYELGLPADDVFLMVPDSPSKDTHSVYGASPSPSVSTTTLASDCSSLLVSDALILIVEFRAHHNPCLL